MLHAATPPKSWIRLPSFFASVVRQGEPLGLWLQHASCGTLATEAEIAVVAPGEVFMTRGWGEVARVCRTRGTLTIHLEYDGASVMSFKVFDAECCRLECCPGGGGRDHAATRQRSDDRSLGRSSGDGGAGGSSDSAKLFVTPETSDDSYKPPSLRHSRSRVGSSGHHRP